MASSGSLAWILSARSDDFQKGMTNASKAYAKFAGLLRGTPLASLGIFKKGLGAGAALLVARELGQAGSAMAELRNEYERGKLSADDFNAGQLRAIPILGRVVKLWDDITGAGVRRAQAAKDAAESMKLLAEADERTAQAGGRATQLGFEASLMRPGVGGAQRDRMSARHDQWAAQRDIEARRRLAEQGLEDRRKLEWIERRTAGGTLERVPNPLFSKPAGSTDTAFRAEMMALRSEEFQAQEKLSSRLDEINRKAAKEREEQIDKWRTAWHKAYDSVWSKARDTWLKVGEQWREFERGQREHRRAQREDFLQDIVGRAAGILASLRKGGRVDSPLALRGSQEAAQAELRQTLGASPQRDIKELMRKAVEIAERQYNEDREANRNLKTIARLLKQPGGEI